MTADAPHPATTTATAARGTMNSRSMLGYTRTGRAPLDETVVFVEA